MKIGIFTNNYLPNPYGVTGSIESFRKEMEKMGHEVFIFAPKWEDYIDENPNVFRYPSLNIKIKIKYPLAIPYSRKMDKLISDLDLDIIHSQHPNLLGTAAKKWAKKKGIPLVFTWHTLYDRYTNFVPVLPKKFVANWIIKKAAKYANLCDQVIAPSESAKEIIQNWGVKNRIQALSTGVDEKSFAGADRKMIRDKFKIKDKEILLVLVSRITEEKNIGFLFNAVLPVVKNNPKAKFLVAGGGYLLDGLKEKTKKENLEGRIFFTGEVKKEEVKDFYAAGDIFVYASKSETQGMIISEAMYMNLPVVAVKAIGIKDAVCDGESGILVEEDEKEFQSALEKLINNNELRKKMGEVGRKIVLENYTSKICAQKLLEIYNRNIFDFKK